MFFVLSGLFLVFSLYFMFMGLKVLLSKRPFLLSAKYNFLVIVLAFASQLIIPVSNIFKLNRNAADGLNWLIILSPLFLVLFYAVLLYFLWKTMQGYFVVGITEDSFREILQNALSKLKLPYEERLSKMRLTNLNTDLQTSVNAWSGMASFKIKDKNNKETEKRIAEALRIDIAESNIQPNLRISYFYLVFGVLFLIFFVGFTYWTWSLTFYS